MKATVGTHYKKIFRNLAEIKFPNFKGLPRALTSLIVQMRMGKIGLRQYLYAAKVPSIEDPYCYECVEEEDIEDGQGIEQSVYHVLCECHAFQDLRRDLLPHGAISLRDLLRETPTAVAAALFMAKTGLLRNTAATVADAEKILAAPRREAEGSPHPAGTPWVEQ
jgi:hypothetical protein